MPRIKYQDINFRPATLAVIKKANVIIAEYMAQGFDLTLRQLYYQFVARGIIANNQKEYSKLGDIVNNARLAGLIDWKAIVDRTREVRTLSHWESPDEILASVSAQFRLDRWEGQPFRPEVWIEKDALVGVFEGICEEFDVPLFSCRGYTSQSEMWSAAQRLIAYRKGGATPMILHFGDHDPSGKDMSRDICDRLHLFTGKVLDFERLALNMEQVEEFTPPPNPCKITDSRANAYIAEFGEESWELDALEPTVLAQLVRDALEKVIDRDVMDDVDKQQAEHRESLSKISDNYEDVAAWVADNY